MPLALRLATPSDLDALEGLESRGFSGDRFTRRQLRHLLQRAHGLTLIAEDSTDTGVPLGYGTLLFRRNSRAARLYSLCVAPEARGQGVGKALLEALERDGRKRGCERMTLEVRADNRVALGLYRRAGFRLACWLDDYYEDGCAAWRMVKALGIPRERPAVAPPGSPSVAALAASSAPSSTPPSEPPSVPSRKDAVATPCGSPSMVD